MLTSYETLGKIVAPNGLDTLDPFIESIGQRAEEDPLLILLDFDTSAKTLRFTTEAIKPETARKYAMIPDPDGKQSPVPRLTNKSLKVVLGQGPHLVRDALSEESSLRLALDKFVRTFYGVLGKYAGGTTEAASEAGDLNESLRRSSYFVDAKFLGYDRDIITFTEDPTAVQKPSRPNTKQHIIYGDLLKKAIAAAYQNYLGDSKARIPKNVRWSLRIDGQDVATHPDYAKVALHSLKPAGTDPVTTCFQCGSEAATKPTGHLIKFYTETDPTLYDGLKKGAGAPHFFGGCPHHLGQWLAAQAFIRNHLNVFFAGSWTYIVPSFSGEPEAHHSSQADLAEDLCESVKGLDAHRSLLHVLEKADQYNVSAIDLVFYRFGSKGSVRIREIAPSIPPSRIRALHDAFRVLEKDAGATWGLPQKRWFQGFQCLPRLLKSHTSKKESRYQIRPWQVVHYLLKGNPLPWEAILGSFLRSAHAIHHDPRQVKFLYHHVRQAMLLHELEAILMKRSERLLTNTKIATPTDEGKSRLVLPSLDSRDSAKRAMFTLGVLLGYGRRVQRGATGHDTLLATFPFRGLHRRGADEFALRVMEKISQTQRGNASTKNAEELYARLRQELEQVEREGSPQENAAYVLFGMCDFRMRNPYPGVDEDDSNPDSGTESETKDGIEEQESDDE